MLGMVKYYSIPMAHPKFDSRGLCIIALMSEVGLRDLSKTDYDDHEAMVMDWEQSSKQNTKVHKLKIFHTSFCIFSHRHENQQTK